MLWKFSMTITCYSYDFQIMSHFALKLKSKAEKLMQSALAPFTQKAYQNRLSGFKSFCESSGRKTNGMFKDDSIELCLTYLNDKNISHNTAFTHFSAMQHYWTIQGIKHKLGTPRINLMLKGIKKNDSKTDVPIASLSHLVWLIDASRKVIS